MQDRLKYRAYNKVKKCYFYWDLRMGFDGTFEVWGPPEQCTGLKDKNGKLIYEGDIYTYTTYKGVSLFVVRYAASQTGYYGYKVGGDGGTRQDIMSFNEVIGNIHENPELLDA